MVVRLALLVWINYRHLRLSIRLYFQVRPALCTKHPRQFLVPYVLLFKVLGQRAKRQISVTHIVQFVVSQLFAPFPRFAEVAVVFGLPQALHY